MFSINLPPESGRWENTMPTEHDKQYVEYLEKRLAEAEDIFKKIAQGKCYCSQPAIISCYPCLSRNFLKAALEPHPKAGRSGG